MLGLMLMMGMVLAGEAPPGVGQCEVLIRGLPRSSRASHVLQVGAQEPTAILSETMPLRVERDLALVRVLGPRFRGAIVVPRKDCAGNTLVLAVEPLPARLIFVCPPEMLTVRCRDCPDAARFYLPQDFPPLAVHGLERIVNLELRAPGYAMKVIRLRLSPGLNHVRVSMEQL
jgi:hypothetical protein